ncbi:MAG: gas vesicle protein GvpN [Chloroflexi bacterium]|nr:gas vesicle protein GvpN [Chloroflexota bacterium]
MSVAVAVEDGLTTLLEPQPFSGYVETPFVSQIVERALVYLAAGFPIHFRGPAGTGKTTLALHVAAKLGRPVVILHGDEEFSTSDLVGGEYGYRMRRVIDNFIHSVLKTEEDVSRRWIDHRLTTACRYGFTLIYDEFTRSRPEANNVLLSVLQEKMLDLPAGKHGEDYLRVHPDFSVIFTSNPEEYAGVYKSQDALLDRMVTVDLEDFDEETEIGITTARSGLDRDSVAVVVRLVRALRAANVCESLPSVRRSIMLATALCAEQCLADAADLRFRQLCRDVLASSSSRRGTRAELTHVCQVVDELIDLHARGLASVPAHRTHQMGGIW